MKSNFHLLFYLRKQKNYKGGPLAVYMRITVDGKRAEMSAGRVSDPDKWSSDAGRAIGTKAQSKSLNNYLDSLQTKLRNAHYTGLSYAGCPKAKNHQDFPAIKVVRWSSFTISTGYLWSQKTWGIL
jgi:hypothetical protein